jgi:hypothetical protein
LSTNRLIEDWLGPHAGSAGILPAVSAQRGGLKVKAKIPSRFALIAGRMPALPAFAPSEMRTARAKPCCDQVILLVLANHFDHHRNLTCQIDLLIVHYELRVGTLCKIANILRGPTGRSSRHDN